MISTWYELSQRWMNLLVHHLIWNSSLWGHASRTPAHYPASRLTEQEVSLSFQDTHQLSFTLFVTSSFLPSVSMGKSKTISAASCLDGSPCRFTIFTVPVQTVHRLRMSMKDIWRIHNMRGDLLSKVMRTVSRSSWVTCTTLSAPLSPDARKEGSLLQQVEAWSFRKSAETRRNGPTWHWNRSAVQLYNIKPELLAGWWFIITTVSHSNTQLRRESGSLMASCCETVTKENKKN